MNNFTSGSTSDASGSSSGNDGNISGAKHVVQTVVGDGDSSEAWFSEGGEVMALFGDGSVDMRVDDATNCASSSPYCPAHDRVIIHIDVDCFYAQVEMVRDPRLRSKPLGIKQKTILATSNYVARARGVRKLSSIAEALRICPDLVIIDGSDLTPFRAASQRMFDSLQTELPDCAIERLGLDEVYIDVTAVVTKQQQQGKPDEEALPAPPQPQPQPTISSQAVDTMSLAASGGIGADYSVDYNITRSGEAESLSSSVFGDLWIGNVIGSTTSRRNNSACNSVTAITTSTTSPTTSPTTNVTATTTNATTAGTDVVCRCTCGCHARLAAGTRLASRLRLLIKERVGFDVCAGVGHNKVVAKVAGEQHRPNQQTCVLPGAVPLVLAARGLRKIPGMGRAMVRQLAAHDIDTVRALQVCALEWLIACFGEKMGRRMYALARGHCNAPVTMQAPPRTMSNEDNVGRCTSISTLAMRLEPLVQRLLSRIDAERELRGRVPRTMRLSIRRRRYTDLVSRQTLLPAISLDRTATEARRIGVIMDKAMELLPHLTGPVPWVVRVINIGVTAFGEAQTSVRGWLVDANHRPAAQSAAQSGASEDNGGRCMSGETVVGDGSGDKLEAIRLHSPAPKRVKKQERPEVVDESGAGISTIFSSVGGEACRCSQCGETIPSFCAAAHALYHTLA